jgi:hypothetical protein
MTALTYCIDTVKCNLVEFLLEKGFDVWLFDWRTSPLLAAHEQPYTLDDVARCDWPAAMEKVRSLTGQEQVAVMAHCLSSPCFYALPGARLYETEHISAFLARQVALHLEMTPVGSIKIDSCLDRLLPGGDTLHEQLSRLSYPVSDLAISGLPCCCQSPTPVTILRGYRGLRKELRFSADFSRRGGSLTRF